MKKLAGLLISLLAMTSLTGCEIVWGDEVNDNQQQTQTPENNNPSGDTNNNNGNGEGNGNYNQGEGNNNQGSGDNNQSSGDNGQGSGNNNQGTGGDNNNQQAANTVSISVETLALGYGWENASQYNSFQLDTKISVTTSATPKGNKTTTDSGKFYESNNSYRLYGPENAVMTFQAPAGEKIVSIKLTFSVSTGSSFTEGLTSDTEKVFNANTVALHVTGDKGRIDITAIEVKYTGEAGQNPFVRDSWNDSELALINQYAYGMEIPYMFMLGNKLQYVSASKALWLSGAQTSLSDVNAYAALFRATEWTDLSAERATNDLYFEKAITVNGQERFIRVNLYLVDEDGYLIDNFTEVGEFNLEIYDPYYYEWNAEVFAYIVEQLGSTATIPALQNVTKMSIDMPQDNMYRVHSYNHVQADYDAYLEALEANYNIADDEQMYWKVAVPKALDDLELWVRMENDMIEILIVKRLPHLVEFPQTEVGAYNGGIAIPVIEGAEYFTYEHEIFELDWGDETLTFDLGFFVYVYGISQTELEAYLDLFAGKWSVEKVEQEVEDEEGNVSVETYYYADYLADDGLYYYFTFEYDDDYENITMAISPESHMYYSETFPTTALQAFFTTKKISGSVPVLTDTGVTGYYYQTVLNDEELYDQFYIEVSGDHVEAFLALLDGAGYDVPALAGEYGYECLDNKTNPVVEVDVDYDEDYNVTMVSVYSYADFAD